MMSFLAMSSQEEPAIRTVLACGTISHRRFLCRGWLPSRGSPRRVQALDQAASDSRWPKEAQIFGDDEIPCHAMIVSVDAASDRRKARARNDKSNPRRQARNDVVRGPNSGGRRQLNA